MLHKDETYHTDGRHDVHHQNHRKKIIHITSQSTWRPAGSRSGAHSRNGAANGNARARQPCRTDARQR
ncbi:hypothetical protein ACCAA_350023 [Candidatus Accumulibacter aalborgensis]|uniref:Uncharacterized protein n=1 Tax=Candidatus Accumulibacter aalborgensis TaxID=1860102 RepID=A0A1A8XQ64_9PROT|nr:hypothetical protein ACCAA_350023 [Candidatus Accumulibacter aalborgensis]